MRWTRAVDVAPWTHSDLPAAMVFNNKMWMMGGRKLPGAENCNSVWSSTDGAEWALETDDADWCPRVSPSCAVFKDRMWILGGTENFYEDNEQTLKNDVWSSADGRDWRLEVRHASWPKRTHAQAVVFDNKLWMMGGGAWKPRMIPRNDVWCSEDGVKWTQMTDAAPWRPRIWFSLVVYRDRMWVLGGWSEADGNFGDVWHSKDGANWTELRSEVVWTKRHAPSANVFKDKIWLAGGHAEPLSGEVWSLDIPEAWFGDP
ncbi:MAG: galactose oxidase [Planctomycetaceae bacterium]|nr:galactose oxidase [Planctomycetaceae bacterium]